MTFKKYQTANNAKAQLDVGISASITSLIVKSWFGALYPTHNGTTDKNYLWTVVKFDTDWKTILKEEIVEVTARVGDTFSIIRSAGTCPGSDASTTQGTTAYSFDAGDYFFLNNTAELIKDIQDETTRLETDKADDADVVHKTGDETIDNIKTFTSSPIIPTPTTDMQASTKKYVDDSIDAMSWTTVLEQKDYLAGEAISKNNSLFVENMVSFASATWSQNIGDVAWNTRVAIRAIWSWVAWNTLKLALAKIVSPSVNLNLRIETDNAWFPSWTLVNANATAGIAPWSLTTSFADTTMTLAWSITIPAWTVVWIVLYVWTYWSETVNATNYYKVWFNSNHTSIYTWSLWNWTQWIIESNWSDVTDTDNLTLSSSWSQTNARWYRIQATKKLKIKAVNKDSMCTATKAYIKTISWNTILATATFSWNTATFETPYLVEALASVRVECWKDGASYDEIEWTTATYPQNRTNINYIAWSDNWWSAIFTNRCYNIDSIVTFEYSSANYDNKFYYLISWLVKNWLLSKTDSDYSYKLPNNVVRLSKDNYSTGDLASYFFEWIVDWFSWLTVWKFYFVWGTPWAIATTPWTNNFLVWLAVSTTQLLIKNYSRKAKWTSWGAWTVTIWFYPTIVIYSDTANTSCFLDEAAISNKTETWFDISGAFDRVAIW